MSSLLTFGAVAIIFCTSQRSVRSDKIAFYFISSLVVPFSCKHLWLDGGGGRNLAVRRENGIHRTAERTHATSTQPDLQKRTNTAPQSQTTRL